MCAVEGEADDATAARTQKQCVNSVANFEHIAAAVAAAAARCQFRFTGSGAAGAESSGLYSAIQQVRALSGWYMRGMLHQVDTSGAAASCDGARLCLARF